MNRAAERYGPVDEPGARAARTCALAVFAKAPSPRGVKTRLVPPLTFDEAAALHACFLKDTAESIMAVSDTAPCAGVAVYTPERAKPLFGELFPPDFTLVLQRGDGFGERLSSAVADVLAAGYASVCLIGSDSPTLPPAVLADAAAALARPGERVVLGPADDGGYYLIGLTALHARLFQGIAWSTDRVLAETIERAREVELDVELLPRWYDVDDGASLCRLCEELFGDGQSIAAPSAYRAAHSRRYLAQLMRLGPERIWPQRATGGQRSS
ncbi:MAG TPA: TIGR04282 family arsenosugar biosynthesis glycosyltransferase [bacterium]|nr:TIGR04282 family arsenosugar biosynthesis glycosyltransferase [bacterium]